nr:SRPBCC domain-containing protein [Paraflavitalea speifideiaquila]
MQNQDFTLTFTTNHSPREVFDAVRNVRGWWSEDIEGNTGQLNDEFRYQYLDVHRCTMKLTEVIPDQKVVWYVLENYFSFTDDTKEWTGNNIIFDISQQGNQTQLSFTHQGLVPEYECYSACTKGWAQYIQQSLPSLITTGKGQPNTRKQAYTIHEVAAQFDILAQQEKWFEIQDTLFADNVKSIDPSHSPYFKNAEGRQQFAKRGKTG